LATTALRLRVPIPGSIETAVGTEVDAAGSAAAVVVTEAATVVAAAGPAAAVAVRAVDPAVQGVLEVRATDVSKVATGSQTNKISRFNSPVLLWKDGAAPFSKIRLRAIIKEESVRFLGFGGGF